MAATRSLPYFCICTAIACALELQATVQSNVLIRLPIVDCGAGECKWIKKNGRVRPDEMPPGLRPFSPPHAIEVETDTNFEGKVVARFRGETSGLRFSATGDWHRVSRIVTPLPDSERYRLYDLFFSPSSRKKLDANLPDLKRIDGLYLTSSAGACVLDVQTGNPLHIVRGGTECPTVVLKNVSGKALRWTGAVRICDFLGHAFELPFDGEVASGAGLNVDIPKSRLSKGVWLVSGEVQGEDGSVARLKTCRFAVLDEHGHARRLPEGKFRMGINYHVGRYSPACRERCNEALKACGAKIVRIPLGTWRSVQNTASSGDFDWAKTDRLLLEMHEIGCDVNAECWSLPHFAADPEVRARAKKENDWKVWAMIPPKDTSALESYYEKLSKRYGSRIAYYEIGNEWDLPSFFPGTTEDAVRGFSAAARALRRGCRDVRVSPCGWACADDSKMISNKGIQQTLLEKCSGLYDAHAIHLHGSFKSFRRRIENSFMPLRERSGTTVPWYASETAVSLNHVGERAAAETVWKKILFAWSRGASDYIWYNLRSTGWDPDDPEQGYGMLTPDFYPRATFAAFSALSKLLSGFDFVRTIRSDEDTECYLFNGVRYGCAELVVAGWGSSLKRKTAPVRVVTDAKKAFTVDFMGNAVDVPLEIGQCIWAFGGTPSALRLVSATNAEVVANDLDRVCEPMPAIKVKVSPGAGIGRHADLNICGAEYVSNYFEANPAMIHRLWKGASDCSFKVWFDGAQTNRLAMVVRVVDDRHSQNMASFKQMEEGDCLRTDFKVKDQDGVWRLGFCRTDAGGVECFMYRSPRGCDARGVRRNIGVEVLRKDGETTYKIDFPTREMGMGADPFNGDVSVALKVFDADENDCDFWIGFDEWRKLER